MKKITLDELQEILESEKGATFAGLTYFVDESKSKTVKGQKMVQKEVEQVATLRSSYKKKIDRILEANGCSFDWNPKPQSGMGHNSEKPNSPIMIGTKDASKKYLAFVCEQHTKPKTRYFVNEVETPSEVVWTSEYITPANLESGKEKDKQAVKNSLFNHCMESVNYKQSLRDAAESEEERQRLTEEIEKGFETANKLAQIEELQKLEFLYRTVELKNIRSIRIMGEVFEVVS